MKNQSKEQAQRVARIKAAFAAELAATDPEEMEECVKDMQKLAGLDEESAKRVAAAVRAKNLPVFARNAGLSEEEIAEILSPLHEDEKTVDFAKEKDDSDDAKEEVKENPFEAKEESEKDDEAKEKATEIPVEKEETKPDFNDIDKNDVGEVKDEEPMAQITIEVPASMVSIIEDAVNNAVGGGAFTEDAEKEEMGEIPGEDEVAPDFSGEGSDISDIDEDKMLEAKRSSEMSMTKEALAQRKAQREAILAKVSTRTASEDVKPKDIGLGKDTSFNGKPYQFAGEAQYEPEAEYPKMTMTNSEGNSLKDDPGFNSIPIPTNNPENLGLKDSYTAKKFEQGSPDGSLEYSVDFDEVDKVPSAGEEATTQKFEVPTQLEQKKRTTTVAKIVTCQGCNNPDGKEVHECECGECGARVAICEDCETEGHCPSCAARAAAKKEKSEVEVKVPEEEIKDDIKVDVAKKESSERDAEVYKARLKTAYAVSYQLALAGLIESNEVDDNVELWMKDGLSAQAMRTQGAILVRSASRAVNSATERVASAAQTQKRQVVAVSKNPSFVSSGVAVPSTMEELQEALSEVFSKPQFEKEN